MPSLYRLNEKVRELIVELDAFETETASLEVTGLKPEEVISDIVSTLDELYEQLDAKRASYCHVIRNAVADADALRTEAKHLNTRAKRLETLAAHLKDVLHYDMLSNGEVQAQAELFRLRVAKSPVRVELEIEPELLPRAYQKVAVSANTNAIRQELKDGGTVPGAKLVQGSHLRIS